MKDSFAADSPDADYSDYKNRLGNFTLPEKPINIVAGNNFFDLKKPEYKKCQNCLTRSIVGLTTVGKNSSINRVNEMLESFDDWNAASIEQRQVMLTELAKDGRKEKIEGVSAQAAPFYELIGQLAFTEKTVPPEPVDAVKQLVTDVIDQLQATTDIIDFWNRPAEISKLRGELSDLMLATGVDQMIENESKLVSEITQRAKKRERDILG